MAYGPGGGYGGGFGNGVSGANNSMGGSPGNRTGGGFGGGGGGYGGGMGSSGSDGLGNNLGITSDSFGGFDGGFGDSYAGPMYEGDLSSMFSATPEAFSDAFAEMPAMQEMSFVDPMTEEQRMRRMLGQVAAPAVANQLGDTLGPMTGIGMNLLGAATGLQSQEQAATGNFNSIATMAGATLGGPFGALVGGLLGRSASAGGPTGPAPGRSATQSGAGFSFGDVAGTLGSLYLNNKAARDAKNAQTGMTQGVQKQLQDMFGPNSAYAQQLRQQLARQDAASGRRSQYGPREVELQARLADMQARTAPSLMNSMVSQQQAALQAANARRQRQGQFLNVLDRGAQKFGVYDRIGSGLKGLFNRPDDSWMTDGAAYEGIY